MNRVLAALAALAVLVIASIGFAVAQDEEQSRFVRFVERQISTPDRRIELGRIDGALSSDVRISSITISDRAGAWLTINDVHLVWSRLALLRGRLDVDLLEASSIVISRAPLAAETSQPIEPGAAEFNLPELPVAVLLDRLAVPRVEIAAGLIGPAAALSVDGSINLDGGTLESNLALTRLDRPGNLTLAASFDNGSRQLGIDFALEEPADGVIANALNVAGRPPISFTIAGDGPLSAFVANVRLAANDATLLSGQTTIMQDPEGLRLQANVSGNIEPLVAPLYGPYVAGGTELVVDATRRGDGSLVIRAGRLRSGVANLAFSADVGSDLVPNRVAVDGRIARGDGAALPLPGGEGASTIRSATLSIALGGEVGETFRAEIALDGLDSSLIAAPNVTIRADGRAANLSDPATRDVTFNISGGAENLASDDEGIAQALGSRLTIAAQGAWQAGQPVRVATADFVTGTLGAHFDGTVQNGVNGNYRLNAADVAAFSSLAQRTLGGAVDLDAAGAVGFDGTFDLTLDGNTTDLAIGTPAIDGLLAGVTTIAGRAARAASGVTFDGFRIANPQMSASADGSATATAADLRADVALNDLAAVNPRGSGPLTASLTVTGDPAIPQVTARIASPQLTLAGQTLSQLAADFDGTLAQTEAVPFDLDGSIGVTGTLSGRPVRVAAMLATTEAARSLTGLDADIAGATASGALSLQNTGLVTGDLAVSVPQLEQLAALALQEASGSIRADVGLTVRRDARGDDTQGIDVDGEAREVRAAGVSLDLADLELAVDDAFGIPAASGRANIRGLDVAGFAVRTADLIATRDGETTSLELAADLGSGTLAASGAVARRGDGLSASLVTFQLAQDGFAADLQRPTTVDVSGQTITLGNTALTIGDGSVVVQGTFADTLDLTATIEDLPLRIANLVKPDLAVGGTVSGTIDVAGTRAAPTATADVRAQDVTAAFLTGRGIEPLSLTARGSYADGTATLAEFSTNVAGGAVTAFGTVGEVLDLAVNVRDLPLALANAVRPDLALAGTLSGNAQIEGTASAPSASFDVAVANASAAQTRAAKLEPLNLSAAGSYAGKTAMIDRLETSVGGGRITAAGRVGEVLDVTVDVAGLPLALANAVRADLGLDGTLSGRASATGSLTAPVATFDVTVANASAAQTRAAKLSPLNASARGSYAGGTATIERFETTVGSGRVTASGRVGEVLDATVDVADLPLALANAALPELGLSGTLSGNAAVTGSLADPAATFAVSIDGGSARQIEASGIGTVAATIAGRYAAGTATLETAEAQIGRGAITAAGTVGRALDIRAELTELPLAVVNGFRPGLDVSGTLSGTVTATGSVTDPRVTFDIVAPAISARPIRETGLPPAALDARGTFAAGTATLEAANVRVGSGLISASGRVGETLDLAVDLTKLPLSLANGVRPELGLGGTLSGSARATGSLAAPAATFNLDVAGLTAAQLAGTGVTPLTATASGSFADNAVRLDAVDVTGGGLDVTASGTVPLAGGGLDVRVNATAPLSIANRLLVERSASVTGTAEASVTVTGALAAPKINGRVTSDGFGVRDPLTNLTLANGRLAAMLTGSEVNLDVSAGLGDGTVAVAGTVGLGAGFPADLTVTARDARYTDGRLIAVTFNADLTVAGPVLATPLVAGRVELVRTEITVPTRLSGTAALIEVYHLNTPPDVLETLRRAEAGPFADRGEAGGSRTGTVRLDVTVSAPERIFIRGRGIDAELGGEVRVTGTIPDVAPVGEFRLIRGRVQVLTQRINLTEGIVTLTGDLNPTIRLVAETQANQVTVRVVVEGQVNDPQVRFESVPQLPQDEVLAQLIFGRSIEDLSPFQLAQLAAAVAELAGGGSGPNIIDQVRVFSGLDDLDIISTPSGGTSVQAGRYIAENIYLGVRAGESSGVTINLDVAKGVKVRGEALTDQSTFGIYYEREY